MNSALQYDFLLPQFCKSTKFANFAYSLSAQRITILIEVFHIFPQLTRKNAETGP